MNPDTHRLLRPVHPGRLLTAAALALIALALGAGSALAATPIDVGPANEGPAMAFDAAGAAHLTWTTSTDTTTTLHYCRIDRGGSGCATSHAFPQVGTFTTDFGNAPLLVGGAVDVLDARYNGEQQKHLWTSTNSFASPTVVGSNKNVFAELAFTQAVYAPKGTLSASQADVATIIGGSRAGGARFQATGLTGITEGGFELSADSTADATIGRDGNSLVAVYIDLSSNQIEWRRYSGTGSPESLNQDANWTTAAPIAAGSNEVVLAEGVDGLYLAYQGTNDELLVRHYNGLDGWEAPVTVVGRAGQIAASEDPAGIVHLVWLDGESGELHYAYGRDQSNTSFTRPQTLDVGAAREPNVATDASGIGWVTWKEDEGDAFAIPVEPGEPPLPPAGGGTGGGGGTAKPPTPPTSPAPGTGATKSTTKEVVPGLSATLSTPKACVAGGASFKAKVAVKKKGSKAHKLSYSVKQVGFSVGGKLIVTDKTKPSKRR